jgi:hypothetical protein
MMLSIRMFSFQIKNETLVISTHKAECHYSERSYETINKMTLSIMIHTIMRLSTMIYTIMTVSIMIHTIMILSITTKMQS